MTSAANTNVTLIVSKRGKIIARHVVPASQVKRIENEIHNADPRTTIVRA